MQCMNFALGAERTSIMVKRVPVSWTVDAGRGYSPVGEMSRAWGQEWLDSKFVLCERL